MIKRIAIIAIVLGLTGAIASCQQDENPNSAATPAVSGTSDSKYYCGLSSDGTPTTFVKSDRGDIALVPWESDYFEKFGYTREQRCQAVSAKFQQTDEEGILNYLTIGEINNLPVICASSSLGTGCQEALFTLEGDRNAAVALEEIFAGEVQKQNNAPYMDIEAVLDNLSNIN
ncbi:MAG: COP23 domain-containing protein [Cyanobacteriota bacterium]|nr:COP23 domain-containing protein [Cyanobacteriota bacterium]